MSDSDYAILLAAIGWIENHTGKDCPAYPEVEMLTHVADNISRRREPSDGPTPRSFGAERMVERRRLHRFDQTARETADALGRPDNPAPRVP